jgi:hypothetical protein
MNESPPTANAVFHEPAGPIHDLFFGTPHRVLDKGLTRPILFQLEDERGNQGLWVVKAPSAHRRGELSLLQELAGADLCAWCGLLTPAIGLARFPNEPPPTDDTEVGRLARELYKNNAGKLAFCSRYLDSSPAVEVEEGSLNDLRSVTKLARRDAMLLYALDLLIWNVDRTVRKPNALWFENRLVAIDHGNAFAGLLAVDQHGLGPDDEEMTGGHTWGDHICSKMLGKLREKKMYGTAAWRSFLRRLRRLTDVALRDMARRWPWELDRGPMGERPGLSARIVQFLETRRDRSLGVFKGQINGCV